MSVRFSVLVATAAAAVAATAALSACGSATPPASTPSSPAASSPAHGHASSPPALAPIIRAVTLNTTFSPDTLSLAVGMKFQVIVSSSVVPSGLSLPAHCAPGVSYAANDGMLSVTCPAGGGYLYTTEHPGTTVLSATVRPRCSPGQICPQWIKDAALKVTITPGVASVQG